MNFRIENRTSFSKKVSLCVSLFCLTGTGVSQKACLDACDLVGVNNVR